MVECEACSAEKSTRSWAVWVSASVSLASNFSFSNFNFPAEFFWSLDALSCAASRSVTRLENAATCKVLKSWQFWKHKIASLNLWFSMQDRQALASDSAILQCATAGIGKSCSLFAEIILASHYRRQTSTWCTIILWFHSQLWGLLNSARINSQQGKITDA